MHVKLAVLVFNIFEATLGVSPAAVLCQ